MFLSFLGCVFTRKWDGYHNLDAPNECLWEDILQAMVAHLDAWKSASWEDILQAKASNLDACQRFLGGHSPSNGFKSRCLAEWCESCAGRTFSKQVSHTSSTFRSPMWGTDHSHKPWSPFTKHIHTQKDPTHQSHNAQLTPNPRPLYHPHMLTSHPDNSNRTITDNKHVHLSKEIYTTSYTNHPHPHTNTNTYNRSNTHMPRSLAQRQLPKPKHMPTLHHTHPSTNNTNMPHPPTKKTPPHDHKLTLIYNTQTPTP